MSVIDNYTDTTFDRESLIIDTIPFVQGIAYGMYEKLPVFGDFDLDDLVQAGCLGLCKAANRWNPRHGVPFKAYAWVFINGAIVDFLRERDFLPKSARDRIKKINDATEKIMRDTDSVPKDEQIAEEAGIDIDDLRRLQGTQITSFDEVLNSEGVPLYEVIQDQYSLNPEQALLQKEVVNIAREVFLQLSPKHKRIVEGYFFHFKRMREIAADVGLTEARISQVIKKAMQAVKKISNAR